MTSLSVKEILEKAFALADDPSYTIPSNVNQIDRSTINMFKNRINNGMRDRLKRDLALHTGGRRRTKNRKSKRKSRRSM
jgi:hypothetical protein